MTIPTSEVLYRAIKLNNDGSTSVAETSSRTTTFTEVVTTSANTSFGMTVQYHGADARRKWDEMCADGAVVEWRYAEATPFPRWQLLG
jgi:hypothetical protein